MKNPNCPRRKRLSRKSWRTRITSCTLLLSKPSSQEVLLRFKPRIQCTVFLAGIFLCQCTKTFAQTQSTTDPSSPGQAIPGTQGVSPFAGSTPARLVPGILPLSLQEAIDRGLKQNLGLLLSNADIRSARGQRWEQLSKLLPNLTTQTSVVASQIDLATLGITIPGFPTVVGPFSYFDSRA